MEKDYDFKKALENSFERHERSYYQEMISLAACSTYTPSKDSFIHREMKKICDSSGDKGYE